MNTSSHALLLVVLVEVDTVKDGCVLDIRVRKLKAMVKEAKSV